MDHSVKGYLSRRTTEELHFIIRSYLQKESITFYDAYAVRTAIELIKSRFLCDPAVVATQLEQYQRLLETIFLNNVAGSAHR